MFDLLANCNGTLFDFYLAKVLKFLLDAYMNSSERMARVAHEMVVSVKVYVGAILHNSIDVAIEMRIGS